MKKVIFILPVICFSIVLTGCWGVDRDFKSIRNVTLSGCGRDFVTDYEFALGSFELWVAGGIVGIVESDEMASKIISCVSGVQIGIYKNKGRSDFQKRGLLKKIDERMERKGWKYIVKSFEHNEISAVYVNKDYDRMLRELFVVQVEGNEITIVQVSGDIEEIIETAIKEQGLNWNKGNAGRY